MQTRLDYSKAAPGSVQAMYRLQGFSEESGLERPLLELVKARVSQINGCAYCIDMHTKDARAAGETEQRLYGLSAWREAPYYSEREPAGGREVPAARERRRAGPSFEPGRQEV